MKEHGLKLVHQEWKKNNETADMGGTVTGNNSKITVIIKKYNKKLTI